MLTRHGVVALLAGVVAVGVGRVFAVLELFIIGTAFIAAAIFAVLFVNLRRPRITAARWIHPSVLVAGDTGRVDLNLHYLGSVRSTSFELCETVAHPGTRDHIARLPVGSLRPGAQSSTGYQLPTSTRGLVHLGPLTVETRDPLGMALSSRVVADDDEVAVAPRVVLLEMPELGRGSLGNHLLNQARRLGTGDFHGLREYVDGDEPRSISWKASARSENLLVKEHTVEGLRRCTIALDTSPSGYQDAAGFERGVSAAASLVYSADKAGLATRFLTASDIDLRGPQVAGNTMRLLARLEPAAGTFDQLKHDPGDGLGLLVVITGSKQSAGWKAIQSAVDPTVTALQVTTEERSSSSIGVSARTDEEFLASWRSLTGRDQVHAAAS